MPDRGLPKSLWYGLIETRVCADGHVSRGEAARARGPKRCLSPVTRGLLTARQAHN